MKSKNQRLIDRYTKTSKAAIFYYAIILNLIFGTIIIIVLVITAIHSGISVHDFTQEAGASFNVCSPTENLKSSQPSVAIPRNPFDKQNIYETNVVEVSLCKLKDKSKEHPVQEDKKLILAKLVFKNISSNQQYTPSDYDFSLQNERATVKPYEYVTLDPLMPSYYDNNGNPKYELAPNESAIHTIVFEVSKNSNNGKLLFGSPIDPETIIEVGELTWK